jgi:tetratricopeptide (TPR) repeat protein
MWVEERTVLSAGNPVWRRFRRSQKYWLGFSMAFVLFLASAFAQPATDSDSDWDLRIRALVDEGHLEQAFQTTDAWLETYPNDMDARAWHARLQAWTNHWKEAESEYRELIRHSSRNVDLLIGIADVLIWQKRYAEALSFLDQAIEIDTDRMDCRIRRAQALQKMGRVSEAQVTYQKILDGDPNYDEAQKGLDLIRSERRHELRLHTDVDRFNYTDSAVSFGVSLRSQWNTRWITFGSLNRYQRFSEGVMEIEAGATYKFSPRDAFTISGAVARENGIVPRAKTELEYSHGFSLSENGPVRGIETLYRQRWLWYRDARLFVLSPTVILYLPGNWNWLFQYSPSRTAFTGSIQGWNSSGLTRLSFPIKNRTTGYLLFAKGIENFSYAEQIGQLSMQTWGGGMRFRLHTGQEIHWHVQYQRYSGERTLTSVGADYVFHF